MTEYARIIGSFYSHQGQSGEPTPLRGYITFTPSSFARSTEATYAPVRQVAYVVDGILCEDSKGERQGLELLAPAAGVEPSDWTYGVEYTLQDERGRRGQLATHPIKVVAGETLNLAEAIPVENSVGRFITKGERGVGIESIETRDGAIVFTLSDGKLTSIPAPQGIPGSQGPQGPQGPQGEPGEAGLDGRDASSPNLTFTAIEGEAGASVSGSYPDLQVKLSIPRGPAGEDGQPGVQGPAGERGPEGPAGPQGVPGEAGPAGPAGPKGDPGNVTVTQSGAFIKGEGFPIGRVNAPVSSLFIDTAVTNGAFIWRNTNGRTDWRVINGDTGWRNVTDSFRAANPTCTGGRLRVRRENNQLWVSADNLTFSSTADVSLLGHLPLDWWIDGDNSTYPGAFYQLGGSGSAARVDRTDLRFSPGGGMLRDIKVYPIATRNWPSVLPGTAA